MLILANQTLRRQEIVEDPEEKSPYQPERLGGEGNTPSQYFSMVFSGIYIQNVIFLYPILNTFFAITILKLVEGYW